MSINTYVLVLRKDYKTVVIDVRFIFIGGS